MGNQTGPDRWRYIGNHWHP